MIEPIDITLSHEQLSSFLSQYFAYYNTLDKKWKSIFISRVIDFVNSKTFVAQKGLEVNNKVKVILSASAVQLTLGLKDWRINYFETIIVFPADFKNHLSGLTLRGETNLSGFVSLSWKGFIDGYKVTDDNLNLGLHEFTHALRFNGVRGHDTDEFFNSYFPKWFAYARKAFQDLKRGRESIFRKYGGVNINEFLSVVVEHFFESPEEFKNELPLLYSATAVLLNQKTDKTITQVGVLKQEIAEQEKHFKPFNDIHFINKPPYFPSVICIAITIFTIVNAGVFSFASIFMLFLSAGLFLRSDFYYSGFELTDSKMVLTKGFLFFKGRERIVVSQPQIIRSDFFTNEDDIGMINLFFFSDEGELFEETAFVTAEKVNAFKNELYEAYVFVK